MVINMTKLVMVESIATFRHRYVIELEDNDPSEWASDEWTIRDDDPEFIEFSQKFLGSLENSCRVMDQDEFIKIFDEDNDYLKDISLERKLEFINKIQKDPT